MFTREEKTVIVLGGGYSVKGMGVDLHDLRRRGYVIAVNDSFLYTPVDAVVSMDRLWMENRWQQLSYKKIPTWLRRSAHRKHLKDREQWAGLYLFENNNEALDLSEDGDTLDGFNSGVCAINLAYHIRPDDIYLFGFDMKRTEGCPPYWYPAYDWPEAKPDGNTGNKRYAEWAESFKRIARQMSAANINVYNVNPDSALMDFTKIDYETFKRTVCVK